MKLQFTSLKGIIRMATVNVAVSAVLCSCSGGAAEDSVNDAISANTEEVVKSVDTEISGSDIIFKVNTNVASYKTTMKHVQNVQSEIIDTIVIASSEDAVPYTYYLSGNAQQLNAWEDGKFQHKEVLKSYVVCFADGQAAKLNFKQDKVSFKSTQMPAPNLNETAPVLVKAERVNGSDTDAYETYTYTYEMTVCYDGAQAETLTSKVVVLQQKDAITFSGSVAEYNDYNDVDVNV